MADRTTNIYNLTGPNSRVNIQSVDGSTNVVNIDATQLFAEMRKALDVPSIGADKENLAAAIDAMEAANGTPALKERYLGFMAHAANHMEVFAPFLPALTQLLVSLGVIGG